MIKENEIKFESIEFFYNICSSLNMIYDCCIEIVFSDDANYDCCIEIVFSDDGSSHGGSIHAVRIEIKNFSFCQDSGLGKLLWVICNDKGNCGKT